jgi:hypothetical protein
MIFSRAIRLRRLYAANAAWLAAHLARGFEVDVAPRASLRFRGYRRPLELHLAVLETFMAYLRRTELDGSASAGTAASTALIECANEVVRIRVVRAIAAQAAFEWPIRAPSEGPSLGSAAQAAP